MAFPTLTRGVKTIDVDREDNVLESKSESGYRHARKKYTKTRKFFSVNYDLLPEADRDDIITHFDTVGQFTSFDWTDNESNTHDVFYAKPVKFTRAFPGWYKVDTIELVEK